MATPHRPFLTPFLTVISFILFIISTTSATPISTTDSSPLSINQPVGAAQPRCEDGSSAIGKSYTKPVAADCTALANILRSDPSASHERLITRQEQFLRRRGTCQVYVFTHPMIRPSGDYVSFNDLADGIDRVVATCINKPNYKGGSIQIGAMKLMDLGVTGIWSPFGNFDDQSQLNGTDAEVGRVDVT